MGNVVSSSISAERTIAGWIAAARPARKPVVIVLRSTDTSCVARLNLRELLSTALAAMQQCASENDRQAAPSEPLRATTARNDRHDALCSARDPGAAQSAYTFRQMHSNKH
ncbi:hypothetical protein [Bradyrhizobium macuxiense]|uniref:hypothetical protein n=1 Tax=Bradyrhizobium macuxiense TaxID=1755647 RepID=UPI0011BE270B|nr:hypothetical protein [Bradyrhizobium macuxiense]